MVAGRTARPIFEHQCLSRCPDAMFHSAPQVQDHFIGRSHNEFQSRDSAPAEFSKKVPPHLAVLVLVAFSLIAAFLLWLINVFPPVSQFFQRDALILAPARGTNAIPIRLFILSFLIAFGMFTNTKLRSRILITLDLALTFLALCLLTDMILIAFDLIFQVRLSLRAIEVFGGVTGFCVFSYKMLEWGEMPIPVAMTINTRGNGAALIRLFLAGALAIFLALTILQYYPKQIQGLRSIALLGGIGPGLFMVFPIFFITLYSYTSMVLWLRPRTPFAPELTVLMPALNEEYIITHTIEALDVAAGAYGGQVRFLMVDNGSKDETVQKARTALENAKYLSGSILEQPKPGKSHALNLGLELINTNFFVRIDSDTLVQKDTLVHAVQLMADPSVGVVGGIPLPPGKGPFDGARAVEVYLRHGFYNRAFEAMNDVVAIPGMFALYRSELPKILGGFVFGMNGEDTDTSLRIGEMGYRLVVSPKVKYVSEVPATYWHMREQRIRWFRSTLHYSARCRDLLFGPRFSIRGKIVIPFMLVNLARRAMMLPLVIYGLICYLTPFTRFDSLSWIALIATFVGAPSLVAVVAALLNGVPGVIIHLPRYLAFRLMRSYFTLESMMSIRLRESARHIYSRPALAERGSRPNWMA